MRLLQDTLRKGYNIDSLQGDEQTTLVIPYQKNVWLHGNL